MFYIRIGIELKNGKDGKKKWPIVGAVVKTPTGSMMGNFDLKPFKDAGWDGGFLLTVPEANRPGVIPCDENGGVDMDQPPF